MATEVATAVVPIVETRGGDAAPLIVAFCLTDLRAVVKAPWTSPRVATEVATAVVPMVAVVKAPWTSPRVATEVATAVVPMVAVVKAPWTSPRVATEVATTVVPMVEARDDDAAPLIVAFSLTDLRNPIS
ncbi:hypothetical protein ACFX13_017796 [Malus domestica]